MERYVQFVVGSWQLAVISWQFLVMKRYYILVCSLVVSWLLACSCTRQPKKIMLQGLAQGSYYAVTYFDEQGRNFQREIDSIFRAVDLSINLWVDSSVISKVNRNEDVTLDDIFIDNFNIAQQAAALSGGYFDPTVSPIVAAWGFSNKSGDSITPQLIDSLKLLVDYRKIRIEDGQVIKADPAMKLDFNAIAQGYTSDRIAGFLESRGIRNYLVDTGGEIMAKGGKPNGDPWIVGIEKPAGDGISGGGYQAVVNPLLLEQGKEGAA